LRVELEATFVKSITNAQDVPWLEGAKTRHWDEMVEAICRNDGDAIAELLRIFRGGVQFFIKRKIPTLSPDDLHEQIRRVFARVLIEIQNGDLFDPLQVPAFFAKTVRELAAEYCSESESEQPSGRLPVPLSISRSDREFTPYQRKRIAVATTLLRRSPKKTREIFNRYYGLGQTQEQIEAELGISDEEFQRLKSEAKARILHALEAHDCPAKKLTRYFAA